MTRGAVRAAIRIAAGVVGALGVLLGLAVWAVGLGRYAEDYCTTRATTETGVDAPSLAGPTTVRCRFGNGTELLVHDWLPLIWTAICLVLVLVGLAAVVVGARLALRHPGALEPAHTRVGP